MKNALSHDSRNPDREKVIAALRAELARCAERNAEAEARGYEKGLADGKKYPRSALAVLARDLNLARHPEGGENA